MTEVGSKATGLFLGFSGYGIILTLFFSILGFSYFRTGKREPNIVKLLSGIGLLVFPMFVSNIVAIIIIGAFLSCLPWLITRF